MPSLKENVSGRVEAIRRRYPLVDHAVRMVQHYGAVKGNLQAGAVTYFAFLSFFPILALGFFAIGSIARIYDAQTQLVEAIEQVLPGMVSEEPAQGKIALSTIQRSAGAAGIIGLLGVMYAGLGWLSGMRDALLVMFQLPQHEQPSFVVGKARDLVTLALIGFTLVVSVAVAGVVNGLSAQILGFVGFGEELRPLLRLLTVLVGLGANMVLFFALFKLLARPPTPPRSLWGGAVLGAIGFEVLKQASTYLIASTKEQPAFQAFGIALILVVWINYFSRVVMYAAAWAHTAPAAREMREEEPATVEAEAPANEPDREAAGTSAATGRRTAPAGGRHAASAGRRTEEPLEPAAAFALGGATMLGAVALARRVLRRRGA